MGGVAIVVLLVVAAVFRFGILPKQNEYVLQPKEPAKIVKRTNPPACDLKNLSACPELVSHTDADLVVDPRYGLVVSGWIRIRFKQNVSLSDALTVIQAEPVIVIAFSPEKKRFTLLVSNSTNFENVHLVVNRLRDNPLIDVALPAMIDEPL